MYAFDFLEAGVPLTKRFVRTESGYDISPYPMVRRVTSHRREAADLAGLLSLLEQHAAVGHCQLKGLLSERIVKESRAGKSNPAEPTSWLLLDLDFADGWSSVAEFIDDLDPAFQDVSFIFQHSSSAGIKGPAGLRGHVWILLDEPVSPLILKEWLRARNLLMPKLYDRIQLAANGHSLRWPLDITTCQNDKLIYIAPPQCEGFDDPLKGKRFELVRRKKEKAGKPQFNFSPAVLAAAQQKRIDELREKAGLPKAKAKYKKNGKIEILANPDEAIVTGVKRARGFVYLNLNGGDSWGYFFPERDPEILHNFKGEPLVRLRDIAPSFYEQFVPQLKAELEKENREQRWAERRPLVFRDLARDQYYNGFYFPKEDRVELHKTNSLQRLYHFMIQNDAEPPEVIEDWTVVFDPTTLQIIDFEKRWVNTFNPTPYLRQKSDIPVTTIPPVVDKILNSLCVEDPEVKRHFLNWLAYIFQTRRKTGTAWIFHGVSGTGKGVLVSKVLKPLLGSEHVAEITLLDLEDRFNDTMERALILWIDEFSINNSRDAEKVMNRLKNIITEERLSIRAMRQSATMVDSYLNVIIATNHPDPVMLSPRDRRFNVAPAQETPLKITAEEINAIEKELPAFAAFLGHFKVDEAAVRQVLLNQARENMITASQTTVDRFFAAARSGDLDFFLEFVENRAPTGLDVFYHEFERQCAEWCKAMLESKVFNLSRSDLKAVYTALIGNAVSPAKFGRICAVHRFPNDRIEVNGKMVRGARVEWHGSTDTALAFLRTRNEVPKPKLVANSDSNSEVTKHDA